MTDSLPYWKFFADEWISGNIQAHDMETQGVFINLCARAWKDGGYVEHNNDKLARLLRVDKQVLASAIQLLLDDDLLVESCADGLSSKFILLQLDERSTLSEKRSKAGRKGGKAKQLARLSKSQASVKQTGSIKELELEKELEKELKTKGVFVPSDIKKPYGEFKNVKLTADELQKLRDIHGDDTLKKGICCLGDWMQSTGKSRKDHYACLKSNSWVWARVKEDERTKNTDQSGSEYREVGQ